MFQSNDAAFGKHTIAVEDDAQNVTAIGTVSGDKMSLDVLTSDMSLFRLKLIMSGKSIFRNYHAFSATLESWTKDCYGNHRSMIQRIH